MSMAAASRRRFSTNAFRASEEMSRLARSNGTSENFIKAHFSFSRLANVE
jgi:hypothetical protein